MIKLFAVIIAIYKGNLLNIVIANNVLIFIYVLNVLKKELNINIL